MRTVLITGASSGIGEACAEVLASESRYRLLLCARRLERLEELKKKIQSIYPTCEIFCFELDVRKNNEIETTWSNLPTEWRRSEERREGKERGARGGPEQGS